jgi:hypothetical protein
MPIVTLYKNFIGFGGPGSLNYGLSKRMVQLYLLCLVRDGKVRVVLSGRAAPLEYIDYSNIAAIDFKTALLDAMERVQLVAAPEGWELLAPYAAVLLDDPALTKVSDEADIQRTVQRLLAFRTEQAPIVRTLQADLESLFAELDYDGATYIAQLAAWQRFLIAPVDAADALAYLCAALDKAFGYQVYANDRVAPDELDDLAMRRDEIRRLSVFAGHDGRLRAIARYVRTELPEQRELAAMRAAFAAARISLKELAPLIASETRLTSELLDPMGDAIHSYTVRYLQLYDQVTTRAEEVRQRLDTLAQEPGFLVLATLAGVPQLGTDGTAAVRVYVAQQLGEPSPLRPTHISRAEIERSLAEWPQPPGSELSLDNAERWLARIDAVAAELDRLLARLLAEKAALLASSALRDRLQQTSADPFIAGLLAAPDADAVATHLRIIVGCATAGERAAYAATLSRALRRLTVRRLPLAAFTPAKRTIERADVETVVAEFRAFLEAALRADEDTHTIVELE